MKKLVAALAVIVILTGCVYDPVNYDKYTTRPRVPRPPQAKRLVIKKPLNEWVSLFKKPDYLIYLPSLIILH